MGKGRPAAGRRSLRHAGDGGKDLGREVGHHLNHPRHHEEENDSDRNELRNEAERHLLHGGDGLEEAHDNSSQQCHAQHGPEHHKSRSERFFEPVDSNVCVHWGGGG